ncbi:endo-1,4-beta-xylanase 4 [Rosa chinensis]|uniref:endo-1,4-beta-xylanase 4 n=1 Tax=Rosa chinensis TaxID=74649 RepID=UPI000D08CF3C|nr:endo-1,4-beta-xylanase 4 [Rosa chinensis]
MDAYWRAHNIVKRYKGKLIAWNVVNENLHFDFFERRIGAAASGIMYNWALKADGATPLFLNDFNTVEDSRDWKASPKAYINRLRGIKRAWYLEQILREVHSHPQIQGIVIWSAWQPQGCYRMCLTDYNFKNLATGNVVDKLLHEWGLWAFDSTSATTDANGFFEASLFHGESGIMKLTLLTPVTNSSLVHRFNVAPKSESQEPL